MLMQNDTLDVDAFIKKFKNNKNIVAHDVEGTGIQILEVLTGSEQDAPQELSVQMPLEDQTNHDGVDAKHATKLIKIGADSSICSGAVLLHW